MAKKLEKSHWSVHFDLITQSPTVIDAKRCVMFVVTRSLCVERLARI